MAYPVISFIDLLDGIEKTGSVLIVFEDGLLFISSGCYVIYCSWVFYTEGSDHNRYLSFRRNDVKKIDLTLSFSFRIIYCGRAISDSWLVEKKTKEKGFSLGFFKEEYVKQFPAATVWREGRIVAFANIWQGAGKEEISIDLMCYQPEAPHGVMEYLFIELILWGKREGYHWFSLGMAPLCSVMENIFTIFRVCVTTRRSSIRSGSLATWFLPEV